LYVHLYLVVALFAKFTRKRSNQFVVHVWQGANFVSSLAGILEDDSKRIAQGGTDRDNLLSDDSRRVEQGTTLPVHVCVQSHCRCSDCKKQTDCMHSKLPLNELQDE